MCVVMSVGWSSGCRDRDFKTTPEPYYTVGKDEKRI